MPGRPFGVSDERLRRIDALLLSADYMLSNDIAAAVGETSPRRMRLSRLAERGHVVRGPKVLNPNWRPSMGRDAMVISWVHPSKARDLEDDESDTNPQRVEWNPAPNRDPWIASVVNGCPELQRLWR